MLPLRSTGFEEIILAGELFKRQMAEKRKRSAEAQSKTEAEAYRGYGGYGFGYVGYRGGYGGYRGGYGGYRGDIGDSVTEVVRPEDKRRLLQNEFQGIVILLQSLPFEGIVLLIINKIKVGRLKF